MDLLGTILWPLKWAVELLLVAFHWLFSNIGLDYNDGITWVLSIVGLVLVVRAALIPIFVRQIKSQRKMLEVAPQLKKIQDKYKGKKDQFSREAMSRETMELYKRTGTNPLASCLPLLAARSGEAMRADALALFRVREYDDAFPADRMEATIRHNCAEMQIDATARGHINFDLGDRPGKRSRAFCSPVQVPQEVYLVLRPHGGQSDWGTFLHELGHALHFGYARADYPFEYRWLGDNSVTEAYAMLFDHRLQDRNWLLRYTGLGKSRVGAYLRFSAFEELHYLRRYCAKLLYEMAVYGGDVPWGSLPDLYATMLTDATGFRYRPTDAFMDLDPRYYSTRYLRAWQLQALLDASLTERFDEDWWRNPAAGPWIVEQLFAEGQRETADELARRVAGTPIGFAPLQRRVESLLAA